MLPQTPLALKNHDESRVSAFEEGKYSDKKVKKKGRDLLTF